MAASIPDSTRGDDDGGMGGGISMAPPRRKRRDDEPRMQIQFTCSGGSSSR